jgi:hypothetical protein
LVLRYPLGIRLMHIDERRRRLGHRRGNKPRREQNNGNIRAHDALFLLMLTLRKTVGTPKMRSRDSMLPQPPTFPQEAAAQWSKFGYSQAITI